MRKLSFIFFLAVGTIGFMSATCQKRVENPHRPFDTIDTTTHNGGGGGTAEGQLTVTVHRAAITGNPCPQAIVKLHNTMEDAKAGTSAIVSQTTDNNGVTVFNWAPGTYYVVANFTLDGVPYTSDTTHVKDWSPTNSFANGPQLVTINKDKNYNLSTTVDLRE
jgi:hypothetical protein